MSNVKNIKTPRTPVSKSKVKEESAMSVEPSKKDDRFSVAETAPRMSQTKLPVQEMTGDDRYQMVFQLRDELVNNAIDVFYKNYLYDQEIAFTVHCTHLALNDIIECYFPSRDHGDPNGIDANRCEDIEPETLPADTWAGHSVPIFVAPEEPIHLEAKQQSCDIIEKVSRTQIRNLSVKQDVEEKLEQLPQNLDEDLPSQVNAEDMTTSKSHKLSTSSTISNFRKQSTFNKSARASYCAVIAEEQKKVSKTLMSKRTLRRVAQEACAEQYVPEAIKTAKLPEDRIDVRFAVCQNERSSPQTAGKGAAKSGKGAGPPPRKKKLAIIRL